MVDLDASLVLEAAGCCGLTSSRVDEAAALRLAPMFRALGDPIRLRLAAMIASAAEVCVCELTPAFEVSSPTISHHLKVLREAGLVEGERRGTWVYYRIRSDVVAELGAVLLASEVSFDTAWGSVLTPLSSGAGPVLVSIDITPGRAGTG